jgi:hypothetical protein
MVGSFIIALLELKNLSIKNMRVKPWAIFGISIVVLVISIISERNKQKEERYDRNDGVISSPTETTIHPRILSIGGAKFKFTNDKYYIGNLFDSIDLNIWIANNKLYLSTTVTDETGNIIGKVTANEWQRNPNNSFDKNFDDNAIEILDNKGNVVLQAELKGDEVQFAGFFVKKNNWTVELYPAGKDSGAYMGLWPLNKLQPHHIDSMFNYPSSQHRGERIKKN